MTLADLVRDTGDVAGVSRDPTDDVVLVAAIEGRADVIVTGDEDSLILEEHQGVAILTPRKFLDGSRTRRPGSPACRRHPTRAPGRAPRGGLSARSGTVSRCRKPLPTCGSFG